MIVLGIDTSCDDTGVGIAQGNKVLANSVASQTAIHASWGGVVPEKASREHLSVIDAVVDEALATAKLELSQIDAVAATYGPGLVGALLVGLNYAKALAWSLGKPFIGVHHLEGHIASSLGAAQLEPPFLCLIASGGHTSLFAVSRWGKYEELGKTRDDAAGEAFDKVARLLGLGFPGGPELASLAETGDDQGVSLPMPLRGQGGYEFSFSGLKTAVSVLLQKQPELNKADLAASFERVVVDSLIDVVVRASAATGYTDVVVAGGVAANQRLRRGFIDAKLNAFFPPLSLATDNGAMIALAAHYKLGQNSNWLRDAQPYLPLDASLRSSASS
ncbi:MAG: tRNA (adenosine(37)-N6)-threonylcarbamoyltransferase complex transferase subunit TsaD [Trueperaceae bacterium]|nr:tRNA (adenosine(37)-N6)-threonylcarbamoyltransferase complex transferase subunit TsaD [Trueperaceae bacterium]